MKIAIIESLFILIVSIMGGSGLFLIKCDSFLQWSFFVGMVAPSIWFICHRISIELENAKN